MMPVGASAARHILIFNLLFELCLGTTDNPGTKCLRDPDFGDTFPKNVYYCTDPIKTECCEENSDFTCCEKPAEHAFKHQAILWGAVFGVVGLVAIIWICYRKDTYMCEGETLNNRFRRCCGCEKKVNPEDEKVELSDFSEKGETQNRWQESETVTDIDAYYDNQEPVTSRGITPVVKGRSGQMFYYDGNDSDSGRGSTTSIEGNRNAPKTPPEEQGNPTLLNSNGDDPETGKVNENMDEMADGIADDENPNTYVDVASTKDKKKKKKRKNKKKKKLNDVEEEDDTMEF